MGFIQAASAFGSQPFGKAMEGLNKTKAPQPLNYEEWKADTGQAGASGYQNYTQGAQFTPNPALGQQGVQSPQPPPAQPQPPPEDSYGGTGDAYRAWVAGGRVGPRPSLIQAPPPQPGNMNLFNNEAATGGQGQVPPQPPPPQPPPNNYSNAVAGSGNLNPQLLQWFLSNYGNIMNQRNQ